MLINSFIRFELKLVDLENIVFANTKCVYCYKICITNDTLQVLNVLFVSVP